MTANETLKEHVRLADWMVWRFCRRSPEVLRYVGWHDLHQVARMALIKAGAAYDVSYDCRFSTLAHLYIKHALIDELRRSHPLRAGRSCQRVGRILATFRRHPVESLVGDVVAKRRPPHPSERLERQELQAIVRTALSRLSARHRFVLEERSRGKTLEDVGKVLGVTRGRVRGIEAAGHRKLAFQLQTVRGWRDYEEGESAPLPPRKPVTPPVPTPWVWRLAGAASPRP